MGLIKSANAPATAQRFSMADIENHARQILLRARQQAEELITGAQQEIEAMREAAVAEGRQAGHAEGLKQGLEEGKKAGHAQALNENRAQLQALVKTLTATAADLDQQRRKLKADAVEDVIELAVEIARRVTKTYAITDPATATANVAEALRLVVHASDIRIAVHPSQKAVLEKELPALQMRWPGLEHVDLVADAALAPGGCRIFTKSGVIDGDLNTQLDRVVGDLLPRKSAGAEQGAAA